MIIYLQEKENITIRGIDCTNASKHTVEIQNAAGTILFKLTFNNDGSLYDFYENGEKRSAKVKMVGIESEVQCAIHVSGHYCPICEKIIE